MTLNWGHIDGSLLALRLRKLWWLARRRSRWPLLRRGVAPSLEHGGLLAGRRFRSAIDIGANLGQFAVWAVDVLGVQHIVCIDPLPDAKEQLGATATHLRPCRVEIVSAALGSARGKQTLHITAASDSSSLLPISPADGLPGALREVGTHEVDVLVGDELLFSLGPFERPTLVKIDVQGAEIDVLSGLTNVLSSADAVLVEVSFADLYAGQSDASSVTALLIDAGFALAGVARVPGSSRSWELDQADFLFERK
ncbi:MAG: Methyltransferase FkbM [Marmoricola sp.]|nr:Methyltransferase FkbM [Marmoricola sp.]